MADNAPKDDGAYVTDASKDAIPVQSDDAAVEETQDAETADSDEQLERDDAEAIDKSNIIDERTRGAQPEEGSYQEPSDKIPGVDQ